MDWQARAQSRVTADEYAAADPFPHCVIDDFFDADRLEAVLSEWPRDFHVKECATSVKSHLSDLRLMGPETQLVIDELNSPRSLRWLEGLTGFNDLQADAKLLGGGLHHIEKDGFLNVHADFNWHPQMMAVRRLNLLLYLNKDWTWNGDLLLCNQDRKVVKKVAPVFNRCVIFTTTDTSYHGHPEPLVSPRPRKSIALYYYQEAERPAWVHNTLYVEPITSTSVADRAASVATSGYGG